MRTLWIVLVCLCACKRHHPVQQAVHADAGLALQSFAEGMAALCAGKPNDAAYFKSHLMNPEVITLYEATGELSPAKRAERIRVAVAKANLGSCALLEKMLAAPPANAPTVTGLGLVELAPRALAISATDTGIVVDGKAAELASVEQTMTAIAKA